MGTREASGTVVLVHGGFVDGSGWQGVYDQLTEDGYSVAVVQNPTLSLKGDVAATKRVIDAHSEPVTLVGYSYGGAVITEAGTRPKAWARSRPLTATTPPHWSIAILACPPATQS